MYDKIISGWLGENKGEREGGKGERERGKVGGKEAYDRCILEIITLLDQL